jgi:hypothetical protein
MNVLGVLAVLAGTAVLFTIWRSAFRQLMGLDRRRSNHRSP